ncbi:hypothetical protein GGF38_002132, partial [Coemansia sp. RSA 25]
MSQRHSSSPIPAHSSAASLPGTTSTSTSTSSMHTQGRRPTTTSGGGGGSSLEMTAPAPGPATLAVCSVAACGAFSPPPPPPHMPPAGAAAAGAAKGGRRRPLSLHLLGTRPLLPPTPNEAAAFSAAIHRQSPLLGSPAPPPLQALGHIKLTTTTTTASISAIPPSSASPPPAAMSPQPPPLPPPSSAASADPPPAAAAARRAPSNRALLRPNSIFYRPRRRSAALPPPPQPPDDADADDSPANGDATASISGSDDDADADEAPQQERPLLHGWLEAEEQRLDELRRREVAASELAWVLPFGRCIIAPETSFEPMYSQALAYATRPTVIPAPLQVDKYASSNSHWPTAEIITNTIEHLYLIRPGNVPIVNITIDRRLSCEEDFIWNLIDHTKTDMWVAIACIILLQRCVHPRNMIENAPYGSRHALYLGILMVATTQTVFSDQIDQYSHDKILAIIGKPFTKLDLVRYQREALVALDYRAWISRDDVEYYGRHNQFDIAFLDSSFEHYKVRQHMRSILRQRELKEKEEKRALCAYLDRFMHRAPHDSGGSWNKETVYCTETRFLFRHLPWFPGLVNPLYISARCDKIVEYSNDRKTKPSFSPLLPPLKDRNLNSYF